MSMPPLPAVDGLVPPVGGCMVLGPPVIGAGPAVEPAAPIGAGPMPPGVAGSMFIPGGGGASPFGLSSLAPHPAQTVIRQMQASHLLSRTIGLLTHSPTHPTAPRTAHCASDAHPTVRLSYSVSNHGQ